MTTKRKVKGALLDILHPAEAACYSDIYCHTMKCGYQLSTLYNIIMKLWNQAVSQVSHNFLVPLQVDSKLLKLLLYFSAPYVVHTL